MKVRFEVVLDPTELWTVWDKEADEPAVFGGRPLSGLTKDEGEAACEMLNKIHQKRKREDAA